MSINVEKIDANVISVKPIPERPNGNEERENWFAAQKHLARFACMNKALTIISRVSIADILSADVTRFWRRFVARDDKLYGKHRISVRNIYHDHYDYTLTDLYAIPANVLDDLVDSEEFLNGMLWFFVRRAGADTSDDVMRALVEEVANKSDFLQMPAIDTNTELFVCISDGNQLIWINPRTATTDDIDKLIADIINDIK